MNLEGAYQLLKQRGVDQIITILRRRQDCRKEFLTRRLQS